MGFRGILCLFEAQRMQGSREEQVGMVIDRDRWMAEVIKSESTAAGRRPAFAGAGAGKARERRARFFSYNAAGIVGKAREGLTAVPHIHQLNNGKRKK